MKVRPEGPLDAKIALIGEAPGREEASTGRPFVGETGQLLNTLMHNARVIRNECYIDNTIRFRPPDNDAKSLISCNTKGVVSYTKEFQVEREALKTRLENTKANIIVAFGNIAMYALTGKWGITKWRGSVIESTLLPGRKVLCCLHPSSALPFRDYLAQRLVMKDLSRALEESKSPDIEPENYRAFINSTFTETEGFLKFCSEPPEDASIACDIEVLNGEVSCISFCPTVKDKERLYRTMSIPFYNYEKGDNYWSPEQEAELWQMIASLLENPKRKKIFQNGMFDTSFLLKKMKIRTRNFDDTMVAQGILMPDYPKGLDFITSTRTKHPYYKDEGKQWNRLNWKQEEFWLYNARDALVCAETMPGFIEELSNQGNLSTYRRVMKLAEPLLVSTDEGIRVNHEGLEKATKEVILEIESLQEEINLLAGRELNVNSPKQLREYFYGTLGIPAYHKKGKPTCDENAMIRIARKGIPEAIKVVTARKRRKMLGTYFKMTFDEDQRFRGSINLVGTETGRISSSQTIFGTGGNMTNQPPEMKQFYIADPNCYFLNFDLKQAENHIVAILAGEKELIEAFIKGVDIHSMTASRIFGIPVERVIEEHEAKVKSPIGIGSETYRQLGKTANHGLNYDMGYKTFALENELPESAAKVIVEGYHSSYPNIRHVFHAGIKEQLRRDRTITNLLGRKRVFLDRWGDGLFKAAYAQIPQSTVADRMWECVSETYDALCSILSISNTIHDSLVVSIEDRTAWTSTATIIDTIRACLERTLIYKTTQFSIPVEIQMGLNMKDMVTLENFDAAYLEETYGRLKNERGLSQ